MRNKPSSSVRIFILVLTALALAVLACGGGTPEPPPLPTEPPVDTAATAAALQSTAEALAAAQTQQAEVVPTEPALQPSTNVQSYFDDFASDLGNWEIFSSDVGASQITDGVVLLGPFSDCADTDSSGPFGCFTQCLWCGVLTDYDIQVDAAYIAGDANQTFGMVLRFQDQNHNGYVDPEDYYLDFEISTGTKSIGVYQHVPNEGWKTLDQRTEGNIMDGINTMRAYAYDNGKTIELYLNGAQVEVLTLTDKSFYGTVGLVVGYQGMQAGFDNFQITLPPPAADITGVYNAVGSNPDGSTFTGEAAIAASANGFDVQWNYGNGSQIGTGRLMDRLFSVRYQSPDGSATGNAVYYLNDDGSLDGIWWLDGEDGQGQETLTLK